MLMIKFRNHKLAAFEVDAIVDKPTSHLSPTFEFCLMHDIAILGAFFILSQNKHSNLAMLQNY